MPLFTAFDACPWDSDLYGQWCRLAVQPLHHPDWLLAWWEAFRKPSDRLCLVTATGDDGRLRAIAPLYVSGGQLRLLGDGSACTDHAELLVGTTDAELYTDVLEWLIESRNDLGWNCIDFEAVDCGGPTQRLFDASARQGAGKVLLRDAVPSCYIELPTSWEAFLMVLSKNHRKRCRRWCREYFDTGRVACFSTDAGWHPDVAFEVLVMLHNERRAGLGGGAFDDPRFERFLRNALTRLAARGMAEVRAIQMNGRFLAVECVLVGTRAIHAYQSGLAGAGLEHNAGALSTIAMVQSAIDRGMQRLDLMRGTEAYKFHWGARVQPMQRIGWWPPTVGGRLAHSTNLLWDLSKTMVQAVASASPSE